MQMINSLFTEVQRIIVFNFILFSQFFANVFVLDVREPNE